MNLKCLFGFHKWRYKYWMGLHEEKYWKKCIRCGKQTKPIIIKKEN